MLIAINPDNPQGRLISQVVKSVEEGGVIAYPTDTTYGIGCSIFNKKGVERIYQIKHRESKKPFSFICSDLSDIAKYAKVSNFAYKVMKRHLPGPYTFILDATATVPDLVQTKQKTVGIRVPDNNICLAITRELGHPIITTSANISGEDPIGDPLTVYEEMGKQLDFVIDGGNLPHDVSSVISLIGDTPEIIRQGAGDTSWFMGQ
ncbi:MAG: L-threonylcarbamoyladenylate synthase [Desulfuromonadales bacterium]|nr:L-threonylcarbamoyladenylate synthase [Desulfuromonadales bacterium]